MESILKSQKPTPILPKVKFNLGGFTILPFSVEHDVPTLGFLIDHEESGLILFFTDTAYLRYRFPNVRHVLGEANYDENIMKENIDSGKLHPSMKNRVFQSHMEISTTISTLKANDLSKVANIVLLHLSSGNGNGEDFIKRVKDATGIPNVFMAQTGLNIKLNKHPF